MASLQYYIRSTKREKAKIYIRFCEGRKFDLRGIDSNITIEPKYWNPKKQAIKNLAEISEREKNKFNNTLIELKAFIFDSYFKLEDKTKVSKEWLIENIDRYFYPQKYLQKATNLFNYIRHFIENSEKRINPDTGEPVKYKMRREYVVSFGYLQEYAKKYKEPDFADIDLGFYQNFISFLKDKGLSVNTIGKKITVLKTFLNAATEDGINLHRKYLSKKFKAIAEEVDNIYLTKDELKKLHEHDFSNNPRLEKVRDLFIVGCWTALRFSDLSKLTPEKIEGNFIKTKQAKTGKKVVIPLHYTVKSILEKYHNKLPKPISNQKFNDYIKEVAKIAGIDEMINKKVIGNGLSYEKQFHKYELISSHTARRSFCTNAYKDNIPTLAIMAISGHKTEKAFLKYIKADAIEHAEKVLNIWQKNGDFIKEAK